MYIRCSASHSMQLIISAFMHQSILPVPSPPGYCGALAHLVSPGGGEFANFALPGGRAFDNAAQFPSFLSEYYYTEVLLEKKHIGSSVKDTNKLKRAVKACSRFYASISSLLIKPESHSDIGDIDVNQRFWGIGLFQKKSTPPRRKAQFFDSPPSTWISKTA